MIVNADETSNLYEIPVTNYCKPYKTMLPKITRNVIIVKLIKLVLKQRKVAIELNVAYMI